MVAGLIGGAVANMAINAYNSYRADKQDEKNRKAYYEAITNFIKDMDAKRAQMRETLGNYYQSADEQFENETGQPLKELQAVHEDFANQNLEAQQQYSKQLNSELAKQGVRGGQAATLQARGMGQLNTDLQRQINELALNEANQRRNLRTNYYQQKALMPYSTLTTNTNAYLPSSAEIALFGQGTASRYGGASQSPLASNGTTYNQIGNKIGTSLWNRYQNRFGSGSNTRLSGGSATDFA